jgi:hypothetical protein
MGTQRERRHDNPKATRRSRQANPRGYSRRGKSFEKNKNI